MRTLRGCSVTIIFVLLSVACACATYAKGERPLGPNIDDLLNQVQIALVAVQLNPQVRTSLPPLKQVSLELSTSFDKNGKLKLNLFFIKAGGGASASESQTLSLTLKPPKADPNKAATISSERLADQLRTLIISAAEGVANAAQREPRLQTEGLKLALKFGIKKEGEGGGQFTIAPVGIELGGGVSTGNVQTIVVEFGK